MDDRPPRRETAAGLVKRIQNLEAASQKLERQGVDVRPALRVLRRRLALLQQMAGDELQAE